MFFRLTHTESGESREILHFHYTTWPDFGVPQCPDTFLEFLGAVRSSGSLDEDVGPPIVHCSAGIGRSGTFCLVDTCLVLVSYSMILFEQDFFFYLLNPPMCCRLPKRVRKT